MDGPAHENSDSDSGDSWTLLDNPTQDTAAVTNDNIKIDAPDNHDKDDDTDGISIISDSDPEPPTFCNVSSSNSVFEEDHPTEPIEQNIPPVFNPPLSQNIHKTFKTELMKIDDDVLGDSSGKHKIYVHRRNKKISTVLNIIMLGSIITAAGVAFGHLWGARNDCSTNTLPSVNKILSNLYKLQEENAYLRNKLKELTALNNLGQSQKHTLKHNKCKKVFEESLHNNNNIKQVTKCVDDKNINANIHNYDVPSFEKDFIDDLGKLKMVYIQNKSFLDSEINRRMKRETASLKKFDSPKYSQLNKIDEHKFEDNIALNAKGDFSHVSKEQTIGHINIIDSNNVKERKISYADSLKSTVDNKPIETENKKTTENKVKHATKKPKEYTNSVVDTSVSDDDLKKDDRYVGQKHKKDRQKHDRQKSHKKQKRRNKYEQWEMKGGFMKDYDDLSILSSNDNDFTTNIHDDNTNTNLDMDNKVFTDTKINKNTKKELETPKLVKYYTNLTKQGKGNKTGKKLNWYEERALIRNEARKRLEQELFGETSPNKAGWYFRRMQKREQCRAKADNTTHRKFAKQNMNFKIKH